MAPFTDKLFYGVLSFFSVDMGLVAAQRLGDLRRAGAFLIGLCAADAPGQCRRRALAFPCCFSLPQGTTLPVHGALRQRLLHRRSAPLRLDP